MKEALIDTAKGVGTGGVGVVGIEGVQDSVGNDTVGLVLQVLITAVTAGRPLVQLFGSFLGLLKKKKQPTK